MPSIGYADLQRMKVNDLPFRPRENGDNGVAVRVMNCLHNAQIVYLADLCHQTESELLSLPNFGRKSLAYLKSTLGECGLALNPGSRRTTCPTSPA